MTETPIRPAVGFDRHTSREASSLLDPERDLEWPRGRNDTVSPDRSFSMYCAAQPMRCRYRRTPNVLLTVSAGIAFGSWIRREAARLHRPPAAFLAFSELGAVFAAGVGLEEIAGVEPMQGS